MATEIERKYLVKNDSYRDMASESVHIIQGYLNRDPDRTVRVRVKGEHAFLTIKGRNKGAARLEFEYPIPSEDARQLIRLCDGRVIDKIRHIVPYGGFTWEVDEFLGDLSPLIVAEVELDSPDQDPPLPPFTGDEVTGDPRYYNSSL